MLQWCLNIVFKIIFSKLYSQTNPRVSIYKKWRKNIKNREVLRLLLINNIFLYLYIRKYGKINLVLKEAQTII